MEKKAKRKKVVKPKVINNLAVYEEGIKIPSEESTEKGQAGLEVMLLCGVVTDLETLMTELTKRLSPVLNSEVPTEKESQIAVSLVPFARRIRVENDRLLCLVLKIRSLKNRIEL